MKRLCIIGAGGHGKVVADAALLCGRWQEIFFLDDRYPDIVHPLGCPVSGKVESMTTWQADANVEFIVAIGDNFIRMEVLRRLQRLGYRIAKVIHPRSVVSADAILESGVVVLAGAIIGHAVRLGVGVIVNTAAVIAGNVQIGDSVHLAPGVVLGSGVVIGGCTLIGIGAKIHAEVVVGSSVIVGAGAVVESFLPDWVKVIGNPARVVVHGA